MAGTKFAYGGNQVCIWREDIGEGKIKMASESVSRKMVLEIKDVNANNAIIHTENSKLLFNWEFGKN